MENKKDDEDFLLKAINTRAKSVEYGDEKGCHTIEQVHNISGENHYFKRVFWYQSLLRKKTGENKADFFKEIIDSIPLSDKLIWRRVPEITTEAEGTFVCMWFILLNWMIERRGCERLDIPENTESWCQIDIGKYRMPRRSWLITD